MSTNLQAVLAIDQTTEDIHLSRANVVMIPQSDRTGHFLSLSAFEDLMVDNPRVIYYGLYRQTILSSLTRRPSVDQSCLPVVWPVSK